jgi:ribosomal protein S18 acetylase RimI-like enzyme
MSATIEIRPAAEHELPDVLRLWREADASPTPTDTIEELICLKDAPGAVLLVAVAGGRVVGSVIGGWDGWRGNIYRLAVAPECRRQGIGRKLVQEISRVLFDKGARRLSALVEQEHPWAIGFWDSMFDSGYRRDPRYARYIIDRGGGQTR